MFDLVIQSHSDYAYLWPIIEEKINLFTGINTIFYYNSNSTIDKPCGFKKYVEYDEKMLYSERWISLLENNKLTNILGDNDYLIVVHDIQIIVNCEINKLIKLVDILDKYKIDRCSLNVFNGSDIIKDEIAICNLNTSPIKTNTYIPYDLCPTIWKKISFFNLWKTFPNTSYRESELNNNLQNYCKYNFKCYGLQKNNTEKIYYCLGRPYYDLFKVLFITIQGEITFPVEVYMDLQTEFMQLFYKYKLKDKINISNNYKCVCDNFKPI
jgi:hypothetical protein